MTDQEKALKSVKKEFGGTGFTEHHVNYFMVGFKLLSMKGKVLTAVGDSWDEAIQNLDKKRKLVVG